MIAPPDVARYVYFAKANNMMKIGCSVRPFDRVLAIAEWVPFKVELVATILGGQSLERQFHYHFEDEWSHLEWFHISPRMEKMVADILEGKIPVLNKSDKQHKKSIQAQLKCAATRRINQAETRRGIPENRPIREASRPLYIRDAIASYDGRQLPPPNDYVLAAISRYEAELEAAA